MTMLSSTVSVIVDALIVVYLVVASGAVDRLTRRGGWAGRWLWWFVFPLPISRAWDMFTRPRLWEAYLSARITRADGRVLRWESFRFDRAGGIAGFLRWRELKWMYALIERGNDSPWEALAQELARRHTIADRAATKVSIYVMHKALPELDMSEARRRYRKLSFTPIAARLGPVSADPEAEA